jgi:hypothetical protein
MRNYRLELTEEEIALAAQIDLREDLAPGEDGHEIYKRNSEPVLALLRSLSDRDAIPKHRLAIWLDPALNPGHHKGSLRDLFAENGSANAEAHTHPSFRPYLRYFLYGADLPKAAIDEFEEQVGNPEWFSGSDIIALTKKVRQIVRKYDLRHYRCAREFQMLALDNGLSADHANSVRSAAKEAARR